MCSKDNIIKSLDSIYIYHITHIRNLPDIIESGCLFSQKIMAERADSMVVGMAEVKQRRALRPVDCYPGTMVAEYVPFYFCPRSVMLYILYRGNHPGITYKEGQEQIIHLRAPLRRAIEWANAEGRKWCFSLSNATAWYTEFKNSVEDLDSIKWNAVDSSDFRNDEIKEGKQAEFLVHKQFAFGLFDCIGVYSSSIGDQVEHYLDGLEERPVTVVHKEWYY